MLLMKPTICLLDTPELPSKIIGSPPILKKQKL